MKHFKKGFTLIELMVVISVIAILATISLFGFGKAQSSARDVGRTQIMKGVQAALERYYGDKGRYPTAQGTFTDDADCTCSGGACIDSWSIYREYFITTLSDLYGCGYLKGDLYDPKYKSSKAIWNTASPGWNGNGSIARTDICPDDSGNITNTAANSLLIAGETSFNYFYCASPLGQYYNLVLYKESGGFLKFSNPQ